MENFLADCYKANENWRRRAYEVLVQDHGIYVGGAVKVKKTTSYHSSLPDTAVALITDVNFDKLNLLCANAQYGDYRQGLSIQANVNGQSTHIQVHPRHWNNPVTDHTELHKKFEPLFKSVDGYGHYRWDGAITSSATPLDPSWVTDYREAYDWLVKKRSLERLKEEGVYELVQRFK